MAVGKAARLKEYVDGIFADACEHTAKVLAPGSAEGSVPWKDVDVRTKCALSLTLAAAATERAKQEGNTQRVFGVVVMSERIEDSKQWERMDPRKRPDLIEAVATEKKE